MKIKLYNGISIDYFLMYFDFILKETYRESSKGSAIKNIRSGMTINQKIENMYGTNSIAGRNITSTNNVTFEPKEDINMLIENIIKMMEESNIDEDIIDEVCIIQEQVNNKEPKERRIEKACKSLKKFISSAPKNIADITAIVTNLTLLIEKLSLIQNIAK